MKNFVPDILKNSEIKNTIGIQCIVFLEHGNHYNVTSQHTYQFPLNEDGKQSLEKLLQALSIFKIEVKKDSSLYLEQYIDEIEKKLKYSIEDLANYISPVCCRDIKFEDHCAIPSHYIVKFNDGKDSIFYQKKL